MKKTIPLSQKPASELIKDTTSDFLSQEKVFKTIDPTRAEREYIDLLGKVRWKALMYLDNDSKLRQAKPSELAMITKTLSEHFQLLTGKETERKGVTVNVRTFGDNDPLLAALQEEQKRIITGEVVITPNTDTTLEELN